MTSLSPHHRVQPHQQHFHNNNSPTTTLSEDDSNSQPNDLTTSSSSRKHHHNTFPGYPSFFSPPQHPGSLQHSQQAGQQYIATNECRLIEYRGARIAAFLSTNRSCPEYLLCLPQAFELFLKHLVGGLHTVYTKLKVSHKLFISFVMNFNIMDLSAIGHYTNRLQCWTSENIAWSWCHTTRGQSM